MSELVVDLLRVRIKKKSDVELKNRSVHATSEGKGMKFKNPLGQIHV